ncbi:MFS transporter, partial [Burkholderia gladioli]
LVFGLAALAGIAVTSRLVDRHLRAAVLASLAGFALVALLFAGFAALPAVLYGGAAAWGLSFGGAATLLQTALADTAGDGANVALSMNVVAWNGAIAGGGLLGGVLLDAWGAASFAPALVLLLAIGLVTAWRGSAHGFRPGPRHTEGH